MITFPQSIGEGVSATRTTNGLRSYPRRATRVLQSLPVGTVPLRESRDFRLLWLSALPAGFGMGAVGLAVFIQVFAITGSPAAVGLLGLVQFGAMCLGAVGGSAIVDHLDRRVLLLLTQVGFVLTSGTLLVACILGEPPIGLFYLTSAIGSAVASLHFPTRSAMIPPIVDRTELTTAITLEVVVWNVTMIGGPIVGGLILQGSGVAAVYGFALVCHLLTLATMVPLRRQPAERDGETERLGMASIREGLRYLRPRPTLKGLLWIDFIAMVFGMRRSLFPILAIEQFGRGAGAVGLLMAAIPAGALAVSLTGSWLAHVRHQGRGVIAAAVVWGAAITAFGMSGDHFLLALLFLAAAGGADIVAGILRSSIIQHEVPGSVRGRVWAINFLVLNGGPRLGDLTGGLSASVFGATPSVVAGGLASVAGTLLYAHAVPEVPRYTADDILDPIEEPTLCCEEA
jgi:MFS family permease